MFMGRTNNNSNGINVNTHLYTSYSETCLLKLGAWNDKISLKFHPCKGTNADGLRQYATDKSEIINTSLTVDNCSALIELINEKILPALKEGTECSVSVAMGDAETRKVLTVKTDGKFTFLIIAINVNDQGQTSAENIISHKFNMKTCVINYDPATGSGETVEVNADFTNFVEKLKDVYKLSAAAVHASKYSKAITNTLSSSYNNANSGSSNQNYQAPVNSYDSMEDILPF